MTLSACVGVSAAEFSLSSTQVLFEGALDGSAGADVGGGFFVGATDEDNKLRLYDVKGGPSLKTLNVGVDAAVKSALGVEKIKECDLEGAAKIGDLTSGSVRTGETKMRRRRKSGRSCSQRNLPGLAKTRSWRLQERFTRSLSMIS